jgi:hypothetical protein
LSASGPKPRSAQMHSGAWPTPVESARPTATRARPALVGPASASAARDGTAQHGARHSGGDGANGSGRAPMTVRLPAGHGGWNASSPELLIGGEEKKSGSAAAFLRRGGATVAGSSPATVRRRRSPWSCSRRWRRPDSDGRGARTATVGFGPGDGAVGTSEVRLLGEQRARGPDRGDSGAREAVGRRVARARRVVGTRGALSRQRL